MLGVGVQACLCVCVCVRACVRMRVVCVCVFVCLSDMYTCMHAHVERVWSMEVAADFKSTVD